MSIRELIYREIDAERARQDAKFGAEYEHPFVHPDLPYCDYLDYPASIYKRVCDERFEERRGAGADILLEEVAEAIEAGCSGDTEAMREEIVQVAACCVKFLEALYRRKPCHECGSSAVCKITCAMQTHPYNRTGG